MMASPTNSILIIGGQLMDGTDGAPRTTAVLVRDGRVAALGEAAEAATADRVVNATGCVVTPGFVDLSCNLREPGNG